MKKDKGLTLIELAIVLIVLGILLGIGAGIIGVLIKRVKYNESKEIVNAAVEGIIGYATSSRRLPNSSELNSAVRSTKDAYGKDIAYVYDSNLASTPAPIYGFCGLTSTNITVKVCSDTACTTPIQTINNVAFVVISGDGNYNNQTAGTQGVNSATEIKVYEYGVQVDDFQQPGDDDPDRVEPYDDIVKWVSLNELQRAQGCESLTIASPTTLPAAIEDNAYTYTLTANGGRPPYTWSGTIGNGLTLSSDGTISGTVNTNTATSTGEVPSCSTSISFTATVTDSAGQSVSQNFTIPVQARPVEIITNTLPDAYEGSPYSADIDAIGGDGSYTFSGNSLPSWLTLNTSTGVLSGTPPTDSDCSEGVSNFSVTASSCSNTYTKGYSITVRDPDCTSGSGGVCPSMSLSPPSGTDFPASVGNPFSQTITLSGGQPPITCTPTSPTNCNNLSFSCSSSGATISGTPNAPGTCTFSAQWQDSCSPTPQSITGVYTVTITGSSTSSIVLDTTNNPPTTGNNGTSGQTYPAGDFHNDSKNLYVSLLCGAGCPGYTFTAFSLSCSPSCPDLDKFSYSIESPIYSYTWTVQDETVYKAKDDPSCSGNGCPLPITNKSFSADGKPPDQITMNSNERLALEIRFKNPLTAGQNYNFTLTLYDNTNTPYTFSFSVTP
ncbi:prepilin-type N-terminal cleavage/methylation domain-containing protein [Hydrogenivirga caldilitoris]|uniref:Prepilin-type N-terminal cleavage/methylation domain-containing protein n=1 Tax=Hydrogenivirga caldilitoris TaxID=246264 RepID=A0A497XSM8_9AQUI|nr:putative Ig domain-containing protein [Hydrogenivirga caldilitoris]RLJ70132.1 prepilin-type N-terminal cleavage/methylation domain-containing protein [Hydrogenivirga caldilitoris]